MRPVLSALVLLLAAPLTAQQVIFQDDFNDNRLDPSKWRTVACGSSSWLFERNQRIEMSGRKHLVTQQHFDPVATGGILVRCRITILSNSEVVGITTRSSGDASGNFCGPTTAVFGSVEPVIGVLSLRAGGLVTGRYVTTPFAVSPGTEVDLALVDSGTSATVTAYNRTSGVQASLSILATGTAIANHVECFNREINGTIAYVDDFEILATNMRAAVAAFGSGCAGSNGTPSLSPYQGSLPILGRTFKVVVTGIPTNAFATPFGMIGLSNSVTSSGLPLPADLTQIGMPGCFLFVSAEDASPLRNSQGLAHWDIRVPNVLSLGNLSVFMQALSIDPGWNALGATTSNALDLKLGL